jgi:hypothetical protein
MSYRNDLKRCCLFGRFFFVLCFFTTFLTSSLLPAQDSSTLSGADWLRLAAASHDMNIRKIPPYSVKIKFHWRHIQNGNVIEDHLETFDCKFSGDLFHTKMIEQKVLKTNSPNKYQINYQTLCDGKSFFSYDIAEMEDQASHSVQEYADTTMKEDPRRFGHPLACIEYKSGHRFPDITKRMLSNPGFQVKSITKSENGNVVVDARLLEQTDTNRFTIGITQGNLFTKEEDYVVGSKEPDFLREWQYEAKDDYFLPMHFIFKSQQVGIRVEEELEYAEYTPITIDDKTFTKEALHLPPGARYVLNKPGVPGEVSYVGGIDDRFLQDAGKVAQKIALDANLKSIDIKPSEPQPTITKNTSTPVANTEPPKKSTSSTPIKETTRHSLPVKILCIIFLFLIVGGGIFLFMRKRKY